TFVCAKGGRSSGKSSVISIRIIQKIRTQKINILVVRKVANTLNLSVFEQLKWAIIRLGVWSEFKFTVSPLRIIYKKTGATIYFAGLDDPQKLKSFKTSLFPITDVWFEELAEFKSELEVETVVDSIVRGRLPRGLKFTVWFSYNPPKRKSNWVNIKFSIDVPNTFIHKSDYTHNPWVGETFTKKALLKKQTNELFYRWYYMGEELGDGFAPFSNVVVEDFDKTKLRNISQGLDFGWTAPMAFTRVAFENNSLYVLDEIYQRGLGLDNLKNRIFEKGFNDFTVRADNEDPRSIDDLKKNKVNIIKADKGKKSIGFGLDWLGSLDKIVIHRSCLNTAREFLGAEWKLDKDGNEIDELDGDDHAIDSIRYACEIFQRRDLKGWFDV
ncbi:MAG: PBSX family phage terminase large subunit, partial [Cetobacterium sp.]